MCTVSIVLEPARVMLTMNRDEAKERPEAGPTLWSSGDHAYVAPIDLRSGGAWIAVNDRGICACLLNRYDRAAAGSKSRGGILPQVMSAGCLDDAAVRLNDLKAKDYAPFTVLVISGAEGLRFDWTGSIAKAEPLGLAELAMATSSSWNAEAVIAYRRR